MKITIENIGGIWFINGKRLNHDQLTLSEKNALNDFFREYKEFKK